MATTDAAATGTGTRERKVPAFVFDCVCHIFNFDKRNALGRPARCSTSTSTPSTSSSPRTARPS